MPSLKNLRTRIASVEATKKITSAMKMVAASKLKKAQVEVEAARPYAAGMANLMLRVVDRIKETDNQGPELLMGRDQSKVHLIVIASSDRGLCGGFNSSLIRYIRLSTAALLKEGKDVKFLCVGRKSSAILGTTDKNRIIGTYEDLGRKGITFAIAEEIAGKIKTLFAEGTIDTCTVIYNKYMSVISQIVTPMQLIPFTTPDGVNVNRVEDAGPKAIYEFEPVREEITEALVNRNLSTQVFRALLESQASEHGARMSAMDNATRNAKDMIDALKLNYNRTRQSIITKELIEIISGAEAL